MPFPNFQYDECVVRASLSYSSDIRQYNELYHEYNMIEYKMNTITLQRFDTFVGLNS